MQYTVSKGTQVVFLHQGLLIFLLINHFGKKEGKFPPFSVPSPSHTYLTGRNGGTRDNRAEGALRDVLLSPSHALPSILLREHVLPSILYARMHCPLAYYVRIRCPLSYYVRMHCPLSHYVSMRCPLSYMCMRCPYYMHMRSRLIM